MKSTPEKRAYMREYMKARRAKLIAEDPTFLERERAAKRESRVKWREKKLAEDPEAYRAYMAERQKEHRARKLAKDREGQLAKERAASKVWRERNMAIDPEGLRRRWSEATRRSKYGITQAEYEALRERAGCRCEICGLAEKDMPQRKHLGTSLHIDHDHATKKARGLLCFHCNAMLGHAKDDPEILKKAIAYVAEHQRP